MSPYQPLHAVLAPLYAVPTKRLNEAVKRNLDRFPTDFAFHLTPSEFEGLRSQIVTSNSRSGRRYLLYAFTEYGVAMLSSVLNSDRGINWSGDGSNRVSPVRRIDRIVAVSDAAREVSAHSAARLAPVSRYVPPTPFLVIMAQLWYKVA